MRCSSRGNITTQEMSDLPKERFKSCPPFTYVGVDCFDPWDIVTRRTRGGSVNSKRWAVLFSCLSCRAVHIEVIEEMNICFNRPPTRRTPSLSMNRSSFKIALSFWIVFCIFKFSISFSNVSYWIWRMMKVFVSLRKPGTSLSTHSCLPACFYL
jgi:hypothetical protein